MYDMEGVQCASWAPSFLWFLDENLFFWGKILQIIKMCLYLHTFSAERIRQR